MTTDQARLPADGDRRHRVCCGAQDFSAMRPLCEDCPERARRARRLEEMRKRSEEFFASLREKSS